MANAQQKSDSIQVIEMGKALEKMNLENKKEIHQIKKTQDENESLLELVFIKFRALIRGKLDIEKPTNRASFQYNEATKAENRTDPVEEIEVYDGTDTIRGGWFYRLFHKNDFYYKRYKLVDNEKVYLD